MPSQTIYYNVEDVSIPAGARTTTASTAATRCGAAHTVRGFVNVTAVGGTTPSMTLTLETSTDGLAGWSAVGAFAAKTAVSNERKVFVGLDNYIRWTWTISGTTPSLTFSCAASMVGG